jgi:hypothetical protein
VKNVINRSMTGKVVLAYEGTDDAKKVLTSLAEALLAEANQISVGEFLFEEMVAETGYTNAGCTCGRDTQAANAIIASSIFPSPEHKKDCGVHEQALLVRVEFEVKQDEEHED